MSLLQASRHHLTTHPDNLNVVPLDSKMKWRLEVDILCIQIGSL